MLNEIFNRRDLASLINFAVTARMNTMRCASLLSRVCFKSSPLEYTEVNPVCGATRYRFRPSATLLVRRTLLNIFCVISTTENRVTAYYTAGHLGFKKHQRSLRAAIENTVSAAASSASILFKGAPIVFRYCGVINYYAAVLKGLNDASCPFSLVRFDNKVKYGGTRACKRKRK